MYKFIFLLLLEVTFVAKAFGGLINAESLAIGDNATDALDSPAILNWISKERGQPATINPLVVNQANTDYPGNYSRYFGASNGRSGTHNLGDLRDALYDPETYPEENSAYNAISITFTQPVLSFEFQAENFNSDEQFAFLFTPQGSLIRRETILSIGITGDFGVPIWGYKHKFDLINQNVGSIILGSWSSASYYYEFSLEKEEPDCTKVPEPSGALLVIIVALAGFCVSRIRRRDMSQS